MIHDHLGIMIMGIVHHNQLGIKMRMSIVSTIMSWGHGQMRIRCRQLGHIGSVETTVSDKKCVLGTTNEHFFKLSQEQASYYIYLYQYVSGAF